MQPSLGRIVHYVTTSGRELAAIVVHVWSNGVVNLHVFEDGLPAMQSPGLVTSVEHDEHGGVGTWHWPERTPEVVAAEVLAEDER